MVVKIQCTPTVGALIASRGELYTHWCGASWTVCDLGPAFFSHFSLRGKMEPNGGLWAVLGLHSQVICILLYCMQGLPVKSSCEAGFIQSPPKVHVPPSFTCILIAQCSMLSGLSWLLLRGTRGSAPSWSVFPHSTALPVLMVPVLRSQGILCAWAWHSDYHGTLFQPGLLQNRACRLDSILTGFCERRCLQQLRTCCCEMFRTKTLVKAPQGVGDIHNNNLGASLMLMTLGITLSEEAQVK